MNVFTCEAKLIQDLEAPAVFGDFKKLKARVVVRGRPVKKGGQIQKDEKGYTVRDDVFLDAEFWNRHADLVSTHFAKGDTINLTGRLKQESWEDKNGGGTRTKILFEVTDVFFPENRNGNGGGDGGQQQSAPAAAKKEGPKRAPRKTATPEPGPDDQGQGFEAGNDSEIPF
jgi:single-stranded DNA-binding protein